ncbi:fimbrial protein [Rosenbergiella epipactidis]|uniref:fimbrial protein n=1 Tax=Rosenbergiella epipactidis TaxID=1544694 RepID=UPI001F4E23B0|nr:fimbrial protein [Rosenbergiella epipactidis]
MKLNRLLATIAFTCLFLVQVNSASCAMYIYPMEVAIGMKGASQIKVISQDNDVQFIKVNLKKIVQPGTAQEHEESSDNTSAAGLVITPEKIALAASSQRVVRLVSIFPPKKETTWRAYFESVNEANLIPLPGSDRNLSKTANLGVNVVWGALIHVAPEKVITSLKIVDETGKVSNEGTIRIAIDELGICDKSGECQWKKISSTVYPDTVITLKGISFDKNKEYHIKYNNWITGKNEELTLAK